MACPESLTIEILSTAGFPPKTPLLKQEQSHSGKIERKSYAIYFDGLRELLRESPSEGTTKFRGSVCYGFAATRFRGRQSRVQGRTLDPELLHATSQSVGVQTENLRSPTFALNYPVCLFQNALDVAPFNMLQ